MATDALIDDLWGTDPPSNPRATLHSHVAALRRYLRPHGADGDLVTRPAGYVLQVAPERLDVDRFQSLSAQGDAAADRGDLAGADRTYTAAMQLFRGPPLADLRGAAFVDAAAVRLDQARLAVLRRHIDVRLVQGRHAEILGELHALVAAEPLDERLRGQLMVALYRTGQQADALQAYADLRRHLDEELGLRPRPETERLQTAILRQDPTLDLPTTAPAPSARPEVSGAPALTGRLIGRAKAVEQVIARLDAHRVVTLTGQGGVGKTRLALAVAKACATGGGRPVVFVDLAAATEVDEALLILGDALEVEAGPRQTPLEAVTGHLGDAPLLAVLDNVEQIPAIGAAVAGLVHACPGTTVLATSRVPLRIPVEARHPVRPLTVPPERASDEVILATDAVQLFLEHARSANADVPVLEHRPDDLAALCRLLDGLPLAIELAAARAGVLGPAVLTQRIRAGMDIGTVEFSARPVRHRTMHATLAWSHNLLGPASRRMLARLGAFAGGASLRAVKALWDDPATSAIEVLGTLVDAALVRSDPTAGQPRYRMPELVRSFAMAALEASGEAPSVRTAHAAHVTAQARQDKPPPGFTDTRRLAHLDVEADNVRLALRWWLTCAEVDRAAELAAALYRWWFTTGRFAEGRRWLAQILDEGEDRLAAALHAELLMCDGFLAANQADFDHALARYGESAERWVDLRVVAGQARCRYGQGAVELARNHHDRARAHYAAALDLARSAGDRVLELRVLGGLGASAEAAGDRAEAHRVYGESLEAARAAGSASDVAYSAVGLALTTLVRGDHEGAEALANEALAAARSTASPAVVSGVLLQSGVVAVERGQADVAAARFAEALEQSVAAQRPAYVSEALSGLASVLAVRGDPAAAARTFATADRVLDEVGGVPEQGIHREVYDRYLDSVREELSVEAFAAAWSQGRAVGLADLDESAVTALLAAAGRSPPDGPVGGSEP